MPFVPDELKEPFVDLAAEEIPGRFAKALIRGAASFGVSGNGTIFLSGLMFPRDFAGVSSIFLKIFEVEEPDKLTSTVPFVFRGFTWRRGLLDTESFVIWPSALRFNGVSEEGASPEDGVFHG